MFFNSFTFPFFYLFIFGIFTVCNDLSKSNYFLPPRKHLSSLMLKKSKDVFWPPFFGVSANDNNWKIFGDLLRSLYAISQDFTVTKDFFFCCGSKETFFSHSCCTFDFHFRCSSCQSGNVENYCRKTKKFQQQEEVFALLTCPKWTDENERVTNSNSLKGGTNLLLSSTQRFTKQ